jgi:hypothetical protein
MHSPSSRRIAADDSILEQVNAITAMRAPLSSISTASVTN